MEPNSRRSNCLTESPSVGSDGGIGREEVPFSSAGTSDFAQATFPLDFARDSLFPRTSAQITVELSPEIAERLRDQSDPTGGGIALILAALFGLVLHKFSAANPIAFTIVGSPLTKDLPITGILTVDSTSTVRSLTRQLGDSLASAQLLAEEAKSTAKRCACRAAFDFQPMANADAMPSSLVGNCSPELMMRAVSKERAIALTWVAPQGLFQSDTLKTLGKIFSRLAEAAALNPEARVGDLPFMTSDDRESVVARWNATRRPTPSQSIARLFREQASLTPDAVALSIGDLRMSYAALDAQANRLARVLFRHGVGPGKTCSLCLERSFDLVVTVIGILKTGAAYVALDPAYPRDRITYMHTTAQAQAVVAREIHRAQLEQCQGEILFWEALDAQVALEPAADLGIDAAPEDLAYVCFTSGSTGEPKGVAVTQRGCVRLVVNTDYADLGPDESFLLHSPLSFDASTFELWAPLLNGGRLEILPAGPLDLRIFGTTISERRISTLWLTASLFAALVDERLNDFEGVRQLLTGGEVVSIEHARRLLAGYPQCRLINAYGPTENTTFSTCHPVEEDDLRRASLPIGKPIANTTIYILDTEGKLVPPLFPGELYVGGEGVARGYVGDPALTSTRFVTKRFDDRAVRLYRTGDRARWLSNGSIEFLGRLDYQVKIDGHRIELGEIEAALLSLPDVQEAVVIAHETGTRKQLAAFVVGPNDVKSIESILRRGLPDFIVPTTIRILPSLPLNLHGKVDRAGLSAMLQEKEEVLHAPPQTLTERRLQVLWQRCLSVADIGVHDDFFALGGKSLDAAKLFAKISREFDRELALATLVEAPTIAQLAARLSRTESSNEIMVIPFQAAPSASSGTWFLIPGAGSDPIVFVDLARSLHSTHAVVGLQARGLDGTHQALGCASIPAVAKAMISEIIARQKTGPYFLGGHCFGAVLAWEIAIQLEALGHTVGALALLDPIVSTVFSDDVFGGARWPYHWQRLQATPWRGKPAYLKQRCRNLLRTILVRNAIRPAQRLAQQIHASYTFLPYRGTVVVILASDSFYGLDPGRDPRRFFQRIVEDTGLSYHSVPGDHHTILHEKGVEALAAVLRRAHVFAGAPQVI